MKPSPSPASTSHALAPKPALAVVPKGAGHSVPVETPSAAASHEHEARIRQAAYARFEARGQVHGHDLEDWLAAEAELARAGSPPSSGGHAPTGKAATV